MGKIGILTFHSANNYGAFLQTKSLQDYINMGGNDCYVINYRPDYIKKEYSLNLLQSNIGLKARLLLLLRSYHIQKRNNVFEANRSKYLKETEMFSSPVGLEKVLGGFDKVVVGSDQVWNFDITDSDYLYFLENINNIEKYSYAASTGDYKFDGDELLKVSTALQSFTSVSVREEKTKTEIESIIHTKTISLVLDPVFLTEKNSWLEFASFPKEKDYILFFHMGVSQRAEAALEYAVKLGNNLNKQVLYISDQERWYKYRTVKHVGVVTPAEFIGYIANAYCVVTNSFHATAFSIILNKMFFVETDIARNDRILHLLDMFGLENQALVKGKPCGEVALELDWTTINSTVKMLVSKSRLYLDSILSK